MQFEKKPLTIEQQIKLLKDRGLIFNDVNKAYRYLSNVSYYRLSAYWYTFLKHPKSEHLFVPDTTFEKVIDTYVFDRKLRMIIFDEIERIEIALRTTLIYHYCLVYGNNWYEDKSLFKGKDAYFYKLQEILLAEMDKTSEVFIKHYRKKYTKPANPPAWMALELLSFGQLSTLFKNLKSCAERKKIAEHFKLDDIVLESWLEALSYVRNACAHHMRLWNRKLPKSPTIPKKPRAIWLNENPPLNQQNKIYLILSVINYLLEIISPGNSFKNKIHTLIKTYPEIPLHYMGFTSDWEQEKLWKLN